MRVDVQQRGIASEEAGTQYRDYAARRLRLALGRLTGVVQRATIRLVDPNSPFGGVDKLCRVEVRLVGGARSLAADATGSDLRASIDDATERVRRQLDRWHAAHRPVGGPRS